MFTKGFNKIAVTNPLATKNLQGLTGKPAQMSFAKSMGQFGQRPRSGLMSITRLKDGLR